MRICPVTTTSDSQAVTATAASMAPTLAFGEFWLFVCSVACYVKQASAAVIGATPATAGDGSMYLPAGVQVLISGSLGDTVSVIRATADGTASITRSQVF